MKVSKLLFAAGLTLAALLLPTAGAHGTSCGPNADQRQTTHTCGTGSSCAAAEDDLVSQVSGEMNCAGLCEYHVVASDLECEQDEFGVFIVCGYVSYQCDLLDWCQVHPEYC